MFQKKYRLQKEKDFEDVFKKGYYSPTPLWTLKWKKNGLLYPRYGFVVSNKISKSAVIRNKIKRRLRDIVRRNHIIYPVDMVFIVKPRIVESSFGDIQSMYMYQLKKVSPLLKI